MNAYGKELLVKAIAHVEAHPEEHDQMMPIGKACCLIGHCAKIDEASYHDMYQVMELTGEESRYIVGQRDKAAAIAYAKTLLVSQGKQHDSGESWQ